MHIKMISACFPNLEVVHKRAFDDVCKHGDHAYLGTVRVMLQEGRPCCPVDVYIYENEIGSQGAHVCIRYGNEGYEYISCGSVLDFLFSAIEYPSYYPEVLGLILSSMDFFCERKGD